MAGTTEQFMGEVQRRAAGTPYVVTRTPKGFDLAIDLTDAQFWGMLNRIQFSRAFIHHVACEEQAATFVVNDEEREVAWTAGPGGQQIPRLSVAARRTMGRTVGVQREIVIGGSGGDPAPVNYRFSSEEGRGMIREAAAQVGWTGGGLPTSAKIGLFTAIGVVALAVVIVVVLLVVL